VKSSGIFLKDALLDAPQITSKYLWRLKIGGKIRQPKVITFAA